MNKELAAEAASRLSLVDIVLADHSLKIGTAFDAMRAYSTTSLNIRYGPREGNLRQYETEANKSLVRWTVLFVSVSKIVEGTLRPDEMEFDEARVLATISASFNVHFLVNVEPPSTEALDEFTKYNVVHVVWPHIREFLQSTCARTRLPMVTLDLRYPKVPSPAALLEAQKAD